ncbi:MAG TPA: NAD-binding protein [Armatimonadota bacterium]|jgi:voltage-gated potassium channel
MNPFRQLKVAAFALIALISVGAIGFHLLEGLSLLDSLFATVITLTTLGIETSKPLTIPGKIFLMLLSLTGIFVIFILLYSAVTNAIAFAASDKMQDLYWRRKMEKSLHGIKDHYIVCGYGRMGQAIAGEFCARNVPFVVIENNEEQIPRLLEHKVIFVQGDASDEKVLAEAGLDRARGLIAVGPTDAENTFIVLTARAINPKLFIVARSIKVEDEPKLRRAGADRVISPYILGGKRMAWAVLRPAVLDFLESAVYSDSLELEISQVTVAKSSKFADKTLRESGIRELTGTTIIAIKSRGGAMTSSPTPDMEIHDGDTLIVVGNAKQLESLQNIAES